MVYKVVSGVRLGGRGDCFGWTMLCSQEGVRSLAITVGRAALAVEPEGCKGAYGTQHRSDTHFGEVAQSQVLSTCEL